MKRDGDVYHRIADMDNLRLAFWKARRGKDDRPEVVGFRCNLEANLQTMRGQLLDESVPVGACHTFQIHDPKERTICAAVFRERVLHHAIINVCHDRFERFQIHDSYAGRRNKGTYAAIWRAAKHTRAARWFLKLDVRHYFETIDHELLKAQLARLFRERPMLDLFRRIIESCETGPGKGLPIGHLTSQYFANHLLAVLDHYIKEELRMRRYVRYMDDMVLWADEREPLLIAGKRIRRFLANHFRLELKAPCMHPAGKGLPFLGYVLFPDRVALAKRSRKRYHRKLHGLWGDRQACGCAQEAFAARVLPLVAFTEHASNGRDFRRRTMQKIERSLGGLEPREPRRQLEQQRRELPRGVPEQERAGQPQQQPGAPARPLPRSSGDPADAVQ